MDMQEIIKDSVRYPFSSIKNILLLGIIIFAGFFVLFTSFFLNGYFLRIIQSSLNGESKPPKFDNWLRMFIDGLKVYVVSVGYSLPLFLIFLIFIGISIFYSHIVPNYLETVSSLAVVLVIAFLYVIVIIPIFLMALVRMVHNGEFNAAFEVHEILNKIRGLGWKNLFNWYLITIIPAVAVIIGAIFIGSIISNIIHLQQFIFLIAFILAPIFMYIFRSAALFYMSEHRGYLVCGKCGGYYELQDGESPEDYEQCQCGGKLKYSTLLPASSESGDLNTDKSDVIEDKNKLSSFINFKNKKFLITVILLCLAIIAIPILIYSTQGSTSVLNQAPTNYTLLKSYNASILTSSGISITIPEGTQNIKLAYDLSSIPGAQGNPDFYVDSYNIDINEILSPNTQNNIINDVGFLVGNGQNKTGIYNFNNPNIKSLKIGGNGLQGTIKIYTSQ
jgi:hypothetical protein